MAPIGSIIIWPLESLPTGYLVCNGQWLLKSSYLQLWNAIGQLYGENGLYFAIPNYSGFFLRCWDHVGVADPDAAARIAPLVTGSTMLNGNHVGTYQQDQFKSHMHPYTVNYLHSEYISSDNYYPIYGQQAPSATGAAGGNETRPINIYVNYLIKYA
jgi:microcystin-dependent protein